MLGKGLEPRGSASWRRTHDLPAAAGRPAGLPTPEPMGGIEPPSTVYETVALPLSYTGLGNGGQDAQGCALLCITPEYN